MFNHPQFVELNFFAKQCSDEILDPAGNRKGMFEIDVSVSGPRIKSSKPLLTVILCLRFVDGRRKFRIEPHRRVQEVSAWSVRQCHYGVEQGILVTKVCCLE